VPIPRLSHRPLTVSVKQSLVESGSTFQLEALRFNLQIVTNTNWRKEVSLNPRLEFSKMAHGVPVPIRVHPRSLKVMVSLKRPISCFKREIKLIAGHQKSTLDTKSKGGNRPPNLLDLHSEMLDDSLEWLLISGVDRRLSLDPNNFLNGYGCRPWPQPEVFTFASSTATTISQRGFASAGLALQQLIQSSATKGVNASCDLLAESLREQIRSALEITSVGTEIIFSPSGTDAQIQAVYAAQTILGGPLVSVVVASDETGSGTIHTATGLHFGDSTSQGAAVRKGERILGFAEDMASLAIPLRDTNGQLRSRAAIDKEVIEAVSNSISAGRRVLLHAMDMSKFGSRCPSLSCLSRIQAQWGSSVQIVVDACQMRTSRQRLRYYLTQGYMVLITGSKFFTGPPLSGALLVPAAISEALAQTNFVPAELRLYTNRADWPLHWQGIRSKLPANPNVGQLLRWAAAIEEIKSFFAVPVTYRRTALQIFSSTVSRLVDAHPNLRPLSTLEDGEETEMDDDEMAVRTIFPFFVTRNGSLLPIEDCERIYRALNCDVSGLLPPSAAARERQVAAQCCHIGQPAAFHDPLRGIVGTLRISAGARVVSDSWCGTEAAASFRTLNEEIRQVMTILEKIGILVDNFDTLEKHGDVYELPVRRDDNVLHFRAHSILPPDAPPVLPAVNEAIDATPAHLNLDHSISTGDRY